MIEPQIVVNAAHRNAECPVWHAQHQCLYWTDIPAGKMFRYDPQENKYEQIYAGEPVGGIVVQEDGGLLLFKQRGAIALWNQGKTTTLLPEITAEKNTRFNDAIADPAGRVFSGTMATDRSLGRLYRLDTDGLLHVVLEGLLIPNGMGFSPDCRYLYFTDSDRRTIYRFNYDRDTGELSDRSILIITPQDEGVPDGLTVDREGYIWSARWDGRHLFRYSPQGHEVLRINFPVLKVSSATFGGENYDRLYVTTAGGDNRSVEGTAAGSIFRIHPGIQGMAEFTARIDTTNIVLTPDS